jgi:hypothetical protein
MPYAFTDDVQIEELMQEDALFPWLADGCMADETTDEGGEE